MSDHEIILKILTHVEKMNAEMGDLATQLAVLNNRVEMLEKWFWLIVGAVIVAMVTTIWNIIKHDRLQRTINGDRK